MGVLNKATLGQQAAGLLRERIIHGEYAQGRRLAEEELAAELGISRACVRDALRQLEGEGILSREINCATRVRVFSAQEVASLISMRALLERRSAQLCLSGGTLPARRMRECIAEMEKTKSRDWDAFLKADIGFHQALIDAAGDPYVTKFWNELRTQYLVVIYSVFSTRPDTFFANVAGHTLLLETLERGDADAADALIDTHVKGSAILGPLPPDGA